jgi:RNA polymerase sigma-54 factor
LFKRKQKTEAMNHSQIQSQKQLMKFSPQQIQMLNLLQLNTIGIEQKIKDELEENPALEEGAEEEENQEQEESVTETNDEVSEVDNKDDFTYEDFLDEEYIPDYKTNANNNTAEDETFTIVAVQRNTFQEQLKDQMQIFSLEPRERKLVNYLIDSLDDDGYMRLPLAKLADDLSFIESNFIEEEELLRALQLIQQSDPAGVGARTLKECLLLQLKRKHKIPGSGIDSAIYIVQHFFNELSNKNYDKIIRESGLQTDELKKALKIITHLNPKPVSGNTSEMGGNNSIIPEFIVTKQDDKFEIGLTNQNIPNLRLNKKYVDMMEVTIKHKGEEKTKTDRHAMQFIKQKINAAKWFIEAIKQREQTMLKTMTAIVELQKDFFLTGDMKRLHPMILKDVAEKIGMDISTASRVTSTKYVQTQYGTILLKEFFSTGMAKQDGEEVSNRELQKIIAELIETENKRKPFTDFEIAEQLKQRGYLLARRTVAKYREKLNIPIARLRTEMV